MSTFVQPRFAPCLLGPTHPFLRARLPHCQSLYDRRSKKTCVHATAAVALPELKGELMSKISSSILPAPATDDLKQLLEQIGGAVGDNVPKISQDQLVGRYESLVNTTVNLGADNTTTLGTLTFQQFKPVDLKVKISHVELLQGVDSPEQYNTRSYFEVTEGEHKGMKGIQTAQAKYSISADKPNRQDVTFMGIAIQADPSTDLQRWLSAMKDANPTMGDDGVADIVFPNHMPAFRDFLILDDDVHITIGNRGSYVAVRPT